MLGRSSFVIALQLLIAIIPSETYRVHWTTSSDRGNAEQRDVSNSHRMAPFESTTNSELRMALNRRRSVIKGVVLDKAKANDPGPTTMNQEEIIGGIIQNVILGNRTFPLMKITNVVKGKAICCTYLTIPGGKGPPKTLVPHLEIILTNLTRANKSEGNFTISKWIPISGKIIANITIGKKTYPIIKVDKPVKGNALCCHHVLRHKKKVTLHNVTITNYKIENGTVTGIVDKIVIGNKTFRNVKVTKVLVGNVTDFNNTIPHVTIENVKIIDGPAIAGGKITTQVPFKSPPMTFKNVTITNYKIENGTVTGIVDKIVIGNKTYLNLKITKFLVGNVTDFNNTIPHVTIENVNLIDGPELINGKVTKQYPFTSPPFTLHNVTITKYKIDKGIVTGTVDKAVVGNKTFLNLKITKVIKGNVTEFNNTIPHVTIENVNLMEGPKLINGKIIKQFLFTSPPMTFHNVTITNYTIDKGIITGIVDKIVVGNKIYRNVKITRLLTGNITEFNNTIPHVTLTNVNLVNGPELVNGKITNQLPFKSPPFTLHNVTITNSTIDNGIVTGIVDKVVVGKKIFRNVEITKVLEGNVTEFNGTIPHVTISNVNLINGPKITNGKIIKQFPFISPPFTLHNVTVANYTVDKGTVTGIVDKVVVGKKTYRNLKITKLVVGNITDYNSTIPHVTISNVNLINGPELINGKVTKQYPFTSPPFTLHNVTITKYTIDNGIVTGIVDKIVVGNKIYRNVEITKVIEGNVTEFNNTIPHITIENVNLINGPKFTNGKIVKQFPFISPPFTLHNVTITNSTIDNGIVTGIVDKVVVGKKTYRNLKITKLLKGDITEYNNTIPHVTITNVNLINGPELINGKIIKQFPFTSPPFTLHNVTITNYKMDKGTVTGIVDKAVVGNQTFLNLKITKVLKGNVTDYNNTIPHVTISNVYLTNGPKFTYGKIIKQFPFKSPPFTLHNVTITNYKMDNGTVTGIVDKIVIGNKTYRNLKITQVLIGNFTEFKGTIPNVTITDVNLINGPELINGKVVSQLPFTSPPLTFRNVTITDYKIENGLITGIVDKVVVGNKTYRNLQITKLMTGEFIEFNNTIPHVTISNVNLVDGPKLINGKITYQFPFTTPPIALHNVTITNYKMENGSITGLVDKIVMGNKTFRNVTITKVPVGNLTELNLTYPYLVFSNVTIYNWTKITRGKFDFQYPFTMPTGLLHNLTIINAKIRNGKVVGGYIEKITVGNKTFHNLTVYNVKLENGTMEHGNLINISMSNATVVNGTYITRGIIFTKVPTTDPIDFSTHNTSITNVKIVNKKIVTGYISNIEIGNASYINVKIVDIETKRNDTETLVPNVGLYNCIFVNHTLFNCTMVDEWTNETIYLFVNRRWPCPTKDTFYDKFCPCNDYRHLGKLHGNVSGTANKTKDLECLDRKQIKYPTTTAWPCPSSSTSKCTVPTTTAARKSHECITTVICVTSTPCPTTTVTCTVTTTSCE